MQVPSPAMQTPRERSPFEFARADEPMPNAAHETLRRLVRTPAQTFILCPLAVAVFELALHHGEIIFVPWGCSLLVWGYLQYLLVGNYRLPRAGGGRGMQAPPNRIITSGPYRYTRNPMYLGHLIFMMGLVLTFWSWFALILLATRAAWFHRRVLRDEHRLEARFGIGYAAYRSKVNRWIPGIL
jgi:protein-S-isoprenylcysteine O-methyltransferase Ste14